MKRKPNVLFSSLKKVTHRACSSPKPFHLSQKLKMEETTQVTSSRKKPSRVIDSYAAKCRKCNKWRLLDSQEEYEEITSKSLNKSFECNNCEEPEVDYSYNWSTVCILGGSHPLILIRDIKSSSDVLQSNNDAIPSKKKRKTRNVQENLAESKTSVLIDLDEGEEKHMSESLQNEKQATNKGIESSSHALPSQNCDATPSKKKRKRDRKEEATESKKQAINHEKNIENEAITNKLIIEEIEKGQPDGKIAVNGKKVSIIYTGKLKDTNKVFETNLGEAPYRFRLGGENVMKGLSNGVEGMRVGEKRRLIIPPGYLEEGLKEAVPKNAWLLKWRLLKSDDAIGFDRLIQA